MHLPIGLGAGFSERFQKALTVRIVAEDWFAPVAAVHQMINCPRIRTVVIPDTGDMWIGPIDSRLAVSNRGIVGFILNREKELLLFSARRSRIPIGQATRAAFQEEISKFEKDLLAGRFTEDARISIRSLFPHDDRISEA